MNQLLKLFFILPLLMATTCDDDVIATQESDIQALEELEAILYQMAHSVPCTDAEQWSFVDLGRKACGGPKTFLAYSSAIDVELFLDLVNQYNQMEEDYNMKWNIISDCSVPLMPTGIECEDHLPVLVY